MWFTGTLHRCNGFYTVQTVCAIALRLNLTPHRRLCAFLDNKKTQLVCFLSLSVYGDIKPPSCCNTHVIILICVLINHIYKFSLSLSSSPPPSLSLLTPSSSRLHSLSLSLLSSSPRSLSRSSSSSSLSHLSSQRRLSLLYSLRSLSLSSLSLSLPSLLLPSSSPLRLSLSPDSASLSLSLVPSHTQHTHF